MSVHGHNNVGRAVQTDITLLSYASAITERKKCWELLAEKFGRFQTLRNNIQHGVQTDATFNIQQMLGVVGQQCCVRLHPILASYHLLLIISHLIFHFFTVPCRRQHLYPLGFLVSIRTLTRLRIIQVAVENQCKKKARGNPLRILNLPFQHSHNSLRVHCAS